MDAGQLDQSIVVQTRTVTQDSLGADVEAWSTYGTLWAKLIETPGREFLKGDYVAENKAVFQLRWINIDSTARVIWGGRVYLIKAVTGTVRQGFVWLHCFAQDGND